VCRHLLKLDNVLIAYTEECRRFYSGVCEVQRRMKFMYAPAPLSLHLLTESFRSHDSDFLELYFVLVTFYV
jgi:hypothetical protein